MSDLITSSAIDTFMASANQSEMKSNLGLLGGLTLPTVTGATPAPFTLTQTLNGASVTGPVFKLVAVNTSSAAGSTLFEAYAGAAGTTLTFCLKNNGDIVISDPVGRNCMLRLWNGVSGSSAGSALTLLRGSNIWGIYCGTINNPGEGYPAVWWDSGANLYFNPGGTGLSQFKRGLVVDGGFAIGTNGAGMTLASATSQKMAFWAATPVVQQVLPTGSTTDAVITFLQLLGLCRQS